MASILRISLNKFTANNVMKGLFAGADIQFVRTITSNLAELPPKPKPWNYNEKRYTILNYMYDKTTSRFDQNTKVIVVEGPVAAGKSKFAKEIASTFGMQYFPEANLDMTYITDYGYDLRKLDSLLPPDCRSFDVIDFLRNPKHKLVAKMQIKQYIVRFSQYIDALAHVLSTGQGVILDRCAYSDFIFAEAMYSQGYISKKAFRKYYEFRDSSLFELLRPHLIIYLDVPVPKVLENIQKRAISYEKNSPVLNQQYLEVMDKHYKQNYLKEMSKHSELLVYDWSAEGDMEIVIEDIEAIDFNRFDDQDTQLKDWYIGKEEEWACLRYRYADRKDDILTRFNISCFDVPELVVRAVDAKTYHTVMEQVPGEEYAKGYNSKMGDTGILFKMKLSKKQTLPLRERRTV